MKRLILGVFLAVCWCSGTANAQDIAAKTNLLYWATTTPNLSVEFGLGKRTTLDITGAYNPWTLDKDTNKKFKHLMVIPEVRYWLCERFNGHFLGAHLVGGIYNIGNLDADFKLFGTDFGSLKNYRYEGWMIGAGIGYGYQWLLSRHWSLEAEIGIGYIYTLADKYECAHCGDKVEDDEPHHYLGPTKAAISLIYAF